MRQHEIKCSFDKKNMPSYVVFICDGKGILHVKSFQ